MKTFNANKKVTIEIVAPVTPYGNHAIFDVSPALTNSRMITRNADESDIQNILNEKDFNDFENNGKYIFKVEAGKLTDKFQYLYS